MQRVSLASVVRFIEDNWLHGAAAGRRFVRRRRRLDHGHVRLPRAAARTRRCISIRRPANRRRTDADAKRRPARVMATCEQSPGLSRGHRGQALAASLRLGACRWPVWPAATGDLLTLLTTGAQALLHRARTRIRCIWFARPAAPLSAMAQLGRAGLLRRKPVGVRPAVLRVLPQSGAITTARRATLPAMTAARTCTRQGVRAVPSLMYLERQPNFSIGPDNEENEDGQPDADGRARAGRATRPRRPR